ncbi:MAG: gamma carbonic anhydrase family protein [Alphaproteobacteria bacterium]|nr:MAG: gamma carbonic anhydrase family protein [Alphaproteobacteria bacterium]
MALYSLGERVPQVPEEGNFWIAPNAHVMGNVILAQDVSIWWGTVLRGDNDPITIGARSNIQDNSVLHTDDGCPLTIGEGVTVGHKAMLHGCSIGDNTLIGIGATVLNNAKIGKNCLIGAHALVTEGKEIPDNSMVLGAPGKVAKSLGPDFEKVLAQSAEVYVANYKRFKESLKRIDI